MASGEIPSDRQTINQSHVVQPLEACAYEICKCDSKSDCSCKEQVEKIECPCQEPVKEIPVSLDSGGVTEYTSHTAMSKDTLVFPCRTTHKNITMTQEETDDACYKASSGETQASSGETQASSGETQASSGETQTSSGETQTSSGETQASSGETQTSSGETQTSSGETQASSGETQSSSGETQAWSGETQTSSGETQTSSGETQASSGETQASSGETQVLSEDTQVASEDTQGLYCGHPTTKVTIKEVTTEDEAKELLSQMTKEKEVFIKFDWDEANQQPLILELQIAAKSFEKKGTYTITVAILPGNVIENLKVELRELFGNTQCVKVMFNPRKDFTNLLHLGIHIKNLFDIQTCVQCIHSNGRVKDSAMTLDKICEKFGINQTEYQCQDSTDVSTLYVLIQLYTRFRSKDGEWFRATNQMKYMYKQKMARIIHLTRTQSINIHSRVTNATVMSPNQDEINLRDNYNSNRQTLLTYGRQIQDVHNSYSLIHTARFTGNYNTHAQVMDNYYRTLNGNYRRNPQHRQNGNTHKQRYRDYR